VIILYIILGILGLLILSQLVLRAAVKLFHYAPPVSASTGPVLDSALRQMIQPSQTIIERSGIEPGMKVLDLGSGSGTFTLDFARTVGGRGKVYALDMQAGMLKQLQEKLAKPENEDIKNVEMVQAGAGKMPFDDASLDMVLMVSMLQEIRNQREALAEIKRVLKPGGVLAVSEVLVDIDYYLKATVTKKARAAGFAPERSSGGLWSYTARFTRP
jgi:ubiquinone/menaquinone biosynthesis C-methylase UbiE